MLDSCYRRRFRCHKPTDICSFLKVLQVIHIHKVIPLWTSTTATYVIEIVLSGSYDISIYAHTYLSTSRNLENKASKPKKSFVKNLQNYIVCYTKKGNHITVASIKSQVCTTIRRQNFMNTLCEYILFKKIWMPIIITRKKENRDASKYTEY